MTRRVKYIGIICSLCLLLTGCNEVIDLTDEQSELVAEYVAQILLKHDRYFDDRIKDGQEKIEKMTESLSEDDFSSESTTEIVEETTTELPTEATTEDAEHKTEEQMQEEESENIPINNEEDIAKIAGIKGASILYKDYLITKQYPAIDEEGKFIYLDAAKGHSLFVVRFRVQNTANDVVSISLFDKEIKYRIVCNQRDVANPMLTILMDDLGTLETKVKAKEEQEAVLVFQIVDSMKDSLETVDLKVNFDDVDNVIKIK